MERPNESVKILNMFLHPVFSVKDSIIVDTNRAAEDLDIQIGTNVTKFIKENAEEYASYCGGFLSLTINVSGVSQLATILRSEDRDIFHLLTTDLSAEFRTMSLVSQQFRKPLSEIMAAVEARFPQPEDHDDPQVAQINRSLYRLLREVSNLSSAQRITAQQAPHLQMHSISAIIRESLESAQGLVAKSGHILNFEIPDRDVESIADSELIERAIFNLISNAVKFAAENTAVSAKLICVGKSLRFMIQNQVDEGTDLSNLYARFMREPGIEDGRHGIGLGIPLVQYIASVHGGTLLMDQPAENTVRFTMTLPIRQNSDRVLRAPAITFDYLGGHNHALVELSDILSAELYNNI